jgi:hypothetical protein
LLSNATKLRQSLFLFGKFVFNPAEMNGSNAQVGGDIVLGHPSDDMWPFLYKVYITLLRGIPDPGEKFVHVMALPLEGNV